uniref:Serine-threonine/tyrosine-protein kinase catalytic domain-containing protein n=1 Tax=Oryza punctata TaxID=4537 RepID=A0A0E0MMX2_ORYPU
MKELIAEVASMRQIAPPQPGAVAWLSTTKGQLLLVNDYMANGSLDKSLYDRSKGTLDWSQRFHIIANPSIDVFVFGAFLLEVTCGQRPIEQDEGYNRIILVDWVVENWGNGLITKAADRGMLKRFSLDEVSLELKLGLLCSHSFPNARPPM